MLFDVFPMARRMVPLRRRLAAERDLFYLSRESRLVRSENCELVSDANSSRRLAIRVSPVLVASLLTPVSGKFLALVSTSRILVTS
jgi:hypothetical protein